MRYPSSLLVLLSVCAGPAAAQGLWQPEIGVQAGYSRQQFAGTGGTATTFISVPGGNYLGALLGTSALFAVVPVTDRLAVEPQLTAMQANIGLTVARIGARVDYAITPKFYGAAGGILNYLSPGGPGTTQLGLQLAVGYRTHLIGAVNGRLEANWVTTHSSNLLPAFNTYSLLAGFSTSTRASGQSRSAGRSTGVWTPLVGIAGGYAAAHRVGGGALGGIFLPGGTNDLSSVAGATPSPPTLFAILPLGGRWAIEPSFDLHHIGQSGPSKSTTVTAGARFDYAVHGGWYGGIGGQLAYVNPASGSAGSMLGATLAWGYRFHLVGVLGGRFETSYTMSARNRNLGSPPTNTLALLFGATVPLR